MIKLALLFVSLMTYSEWFLRTYEIQSIYPFSRTHVLPTDAGETRLAEARLATPDGETLILWVRAPDPGQPTIFYLPGNAGNLATRTKRFTQFLDMGLGVVALGYRGSSGSSGMPSEVDLSADALLAFDAVARLTGVPGAPVVVYGESLGTAMATVIGTQRIVDAVVLEAPFLSMPHLARAQFPNLDLSDVLTQLWDTEGKIADLDEPLLVLHGTDDDLVPFEHGRRIYRLAGSRQKWLRPVDGAGHHEVWNQDSINALYEFIRRL